MFFLLPSIFSSYCCLCFYSFNSIGSNYWLFYWFLGSISNAVMWCIFFWYIFWQDFELRLKNFLVLFWPWRLSMFIQSFFIVWLLKYLKISFRKYQENWIKTTSNPDLDWVFRYLFESLDFISYRIFKMVTPKSCWEKTGKYLW